MCKIKLSTNYSQCQNYFIKTLVITAVQMFLLNSHIKSSIILIYILSNAITIATFIYFKTFSFFS